MKPALDKWDLLFLVVLLGILLLLLELTSVDVGGVALGVAVVGATYATRDQRRL